MWDRRVIYRDLQEVAEEIKYFQKYDVHNFVLEDDVFTVREERLHQFCDMLVKNKIDIKWIFQTRPNIVPDIEALIKAKITVVELLTWGLKEEMRKF